MAAFLSPSISLRDKFVKLKLKANLCSNRYPCVIKYFLTLFLDVGMDTINYRVNWENASVANVKMDLEDYRISPDVQMIAIFFFCVCVCVCVCVCPSCEECGIKRWCL